jgi:hypothetical protein
MSTKKVVKNKEVVVESPLLGGYFNLVGQRKKVMETIDFRKEELKNLKKQLKDIDELLDGKTYEIISFVKKNGEIRGQVKLTDFNQGDV